MRREEKPGECGVWDPNGGKTLFVPVTKEPQLLYQGSGEGFQEETELLERMHRAQVWVFALQGPSIWPSRKTVNAVLFVSLQIQSSEEGLLYTQNLASTYGDVCCWWVGPWHAVIRIFHPTCIKPVLFAPGRHPTATACSLLKSVLPTAWWVTQMQLWGCHCLCLAWTPHARSLVTSAHT